MQLRLLDANLGLMPGAGGTQRLPQLNGKGRAMAMLVTGKSVTPYYALTLGMVNRVCDEDGYDSVMEYTRQFLPPQHAAKAVGAIKRAVRAGLDGTAAEGIARKRELLQQLFESADGDEGIQALPEKGKPVFKGA